MAERIVETLVVVVGGPPRDGSKKESRRRLFFFWKREGVEARRRTETPTPTAKRKLDHLAPSLTPLSPHSQNTQLTSRRIQEHLEHRARAQCGADDVGDGLLRDFFEK